MKYETSIGIKEFRVTVKTDASNAKEARTKALSLILEKFAEHVNSSKEFEIASDVSSVEVGEAWEAITDTKSLTVDELKTVAIRRGVDVAAIEKKYPDPRIFRMRLTMAVKNA